MHLFPDLDDRIPVWEAMSCLFLDADVSLQREANAQELATSPYTVEELDRILSQEVYPVCGSNLQSVAGEWSGFDRDWLVATIQQRQGQAPGIWTRLAGRMWLRRSADWRVLRSRISAIRAGPIA